jgi:signal peptide peptidase SppA
MHSIQFLSAILKGNWLIEPNFAFAQGSLIASFINRQTEFTPEISTPLTAFAVNVKDINGTKYSNQEGFKDAPQNSVAVISVKGVLMKEDMVCGPAGTATLGRIIQQADNNPNISAIVLHIDSPGGTVDGTEALANIIRNTQKPVVAFADGLMASAALWIGSAANEIIASTDTDEIGSVGVIMRFADWQPHWEKKGVKFHTVAASTSPEKSKAFDELREGNYDSYIKEVLDPIDKKFMDTIKERFPNCEDKHLTGKVFFARDIMGVFVNSIGTLSDSVARAFELANPIVANSNHNLKHTRSMKQFAKLNAVLGLDALESVDEAVSMNQEQLELVESALLQNDQTITDARIEAEIQRDTANASLVTAETQRDAASASLAMAQTSLANAVAAFDAIDPTIAAAESPEAKALAVRTLLAAKPGVKIEGNLETTDPAAKKSTETDWESINSLQHNIEVDENY